MALPWLPSLVLPLSRNACDEIQATQNNPAPPLKSVLVACRLRPPPRRRYSKARATWYQAEPRPGLCSVGRRESRHILSETEQFPCPRTVMFQVGTERGGLRVMASSHGD